MNKQTATKNTVNSFAFLLTGVFGGLSYLTALMLLVVAFTVDNNWVPVNELGYAAALVTGWLLGALLEFKIFSR